MSPRGGDGVYTRPAGIDAVTDTTIESAKYNLNVQDVEADLNVPRPISSGGTGASNAVDAMVALGGEIANQVVTNYATFPFKSGSFYSAPGATDSPEGAGASANYYEGICYAVADVTNFYLEARSLSTHIKYLRHKAGGVWQAWARDDQVPIDLANGKVDKLGDIMTGPLTLPADPTLALQATTKQYVDAQITALNSSLSTGVNAKVAKLGDTMSGNLNVDAFIFARNSPNNASIVIHAAAGGYGTIQAFDYNVTVQKNIVMQESGGNVGIGTNAPGSFKLNVNGGIKADSIVANVDYSYIGANLQTRPSNAYAVGAIGWNYNNQEVGFWNTYTGAGTNSFAFRQLTSGGAAHTDLMTISQTGNLTVAGSITANGVPVGSRALLNTLTASNSVTLTDTTSLTAAYKTYEIVFENIIPVTNFAGFQLKVRSAGAIQASNYFYSVGGYPTNPANTATSDTGTGTVALPLSRSGGSVGLGNGAGHSYNGSVRVNNPANNGLMKLFTGQAVGMSSGTFITYVIGGAWGGGTGPIDGLEFSMVTGNISSGVIRIYGLT